MTRSRKPELLGVERPHYRRDDRARAFHCGASATGATSGIPLVCTMTFALNLAMFSRTHAPMHVGPGRSTRACHGRLPPS